MPAVPRIDQLVDFARHRALRALGTAGAPGGPARGALRRVGGAGGRRIASYAQMLQDLDQGHQVGLEELLPAITLQLDAADTALVRGRHRAAGQLVDRALRLAFHPSVHYGRLGSPLMLQAERFLAPLRSSAAARAMLFDADPEQPRTARGAGGTDGPAEDAPRAADGSTEGDGAGRPQRILVLCYSSWTFIDRVIDDLSQQPGIEFRTADLATLPVAERPSHALAVRRREAWNRDRRLEPVPAALEEDLRWADTVLIEWGNYPFAWFSFLDLSAYRLRILARIHRFEILTPYPMLARCAAFDEIAFVAPQVRSFVSATAPRLEQASGTRILSNIHDLEGFAPSGARDPFELVQIGWATPIKGVLFSLELLQRLREIDDRYVLTLIGPQLEQSTSPRTAAWAREVAARIDELGDGVRRLGFRSDIPDLLAGSGFLLSSSQAEGTHESVAEAAAAGSIPVVRNWPEMAPWGGASLIYPERWIVDDVEAAVTRIRSLADAETHAEEARRCRSWILEHRDPAAIRSEYLDFLGAGGRPDAA